MILQQAQSPEAVLPRGALARRWRRLRRGVAWMASAVAALTIGGTGIEIWDRYDAEARGVAQLMVRVADFEQAEVAQMLAGVDLTLAQIAERASQDLPADLDGFIARRRPLLPVLAGLAVRRADGSLLAGTSRLGPGVPLRPGLAAAMTGDGVAALPLTRAIERRPGWFATAEIDLAGLARMLTEERQRLGGEWQLALARPDGTAIVAEPPGMPALILDDHLDQPPWHPGGDSRHLPLAIARRVGDWPLDLVLRVDEPPLVERSRLEIAVFAAAGLLVVAVLGGLAALLSREIRTRERFEQSVADDEARASHMAAVAALTDNGMVVADGDGCITWANAGFSRLTGQPADSVVGRGLVDCLATLAGAAEADELRTALGRGIADFRPFVTEIEVPRPGGRRWLTVQIQPVRDAAGRPAGHVAQLIDLTDQRQAEAAVLALSMVDRLTGLLTRHGLVVRMDELIQRTPAGHDLPGLVIFNLDRFRMLKSSLGEQPTDRLLIGIGERLRQLTGPDDLLGRVGGDEFAVVLAAPPGAEALEARVGRIAEGLRQGFDVDGREILLSASLGVMPPDPAVRAARDLVHNAEIAVYEAKTSGGDARVVFDDAMRRRLLDRQELYADLRRAIYYRGDLWVAYQPVIDLRTGRLAGFEALIRWNHPTRGPIPPIDFVPIAESTGLIVPLGNFVLIEACRQLVRWQKAHPAARDLFVGVNLSPFQLTARNARLASWVQGVIDVTRVDPRNLKIEVTESGLMENFELALDLLHDLKRMGLRIAIDDFGTGYSSLSNLHRLPADSLKIDRSFVSAISQSGGGEEIVRTIVELARILSLQVIAEGVETTDQVDVLSRLGCEYAQGYLYAKPLPSDAAEAIIARSGTELIAAPAE